MVIVRHVPRRWIHQLQIACKPNRQCALLMDDDQPNAWRCRDVPLLYGLRTSARYWWIRPLIDRYCGQLWVSTPVLQERYPHAILVPPRWFGPMPTQAPGDCRRWGYHGTQVHRKELKWLLPLVEQVQSEVPDAVFEIFGGRGIARDFSGIPRVDVLRPRGWLDYLAYARSHPLAVGVAPLLPGPFNAARSHTKAFDIIRTGAVGIFSAREPYLSALDESGAVMVDDNHRSWADHVVRLLNDEAKRAARFEQQLDWLQGQVAKPDELEILFNQA